MDPKPQSRQPRFIIIRQGREFWEWRYREEMPSKYRTTKVPASYSPPQALNAICHDWCQFHPNEVLTGAWELTEEEILAGKKGIPEAVAMAAGDLH
jgi:hypothetical protein